MSTKVFFIDGDTAEYTSEEFSWLPQLFLVEGIFADSAGSIGLAVSQRGAGANMSVDVATGNALVEISKAGATYKTIFMNNAVVNVPIASNSSGANRVDAIVVRIDVDTEPNALKNNIGTIERVAGTGITALSDGAITTALGSDGWIRLADVTVADADTDITTGQITDTRVQVKTNESMILAPKTISFTVLASDPSSPTEGMFWYNSTSHKFKYRDDTLTRTVPVSLDDISSSSSTDQSQLTADGTLELGEANTTTHKNKIGQSFIPTKSKIRGVALNKKTNSGTFTGTVTIELQADSAGSPSGSALATATVSNADYNSYLNGEFEVLFSSEYDSLVIGDLYWIVAYASTSDNTNHPNFGTNTAGGYANGSAKYNNTTDGWVAISTIDLYFKTLEGNANQIPVTDDDGFIPHQFIDRATNGFDKVVGAFLPTVRKLFFTTQLFFLNWTGTTSGAVTTDYLNWSINATVLPKQHFMSFGSANASLYLDGDSNRLWNTLRWDYSNIIDLDFFLYRTASNTTDLTVGFSDGDYRVAYNTAERGICFVYDNDTLYARVSDGVTATLVQITGITVVDKWLNLRIIADLGADTANFYVDGTLVATITTTFPSNTNNINIGIGSQNAGSMNTTYMTAPNFSIEVNP